MRPLVKRLMILSMAAMLGGTGIPVGLSADPVKVSEAFVTNQNGDSLTIVSLADMKPQAEIPIGGKPAGVAMSPDGRRAYLTSPDSKELVIVDAAAREVTARLKVGEGPLGIAAHPTNGRVYVADWFTHKISVIDPSVPKVVAEIAVGESPSGFRGQSRR